MATTRKPEQGTAGKNPAVQKADYAGTYKERYAAGKALRVACPRESHARWKAPAGRPDPGA